MQLSEFKAWFDGYTEAMTGTPTKAQWARIKERIAEIDGRPITERVFVDRYWPSYPVYTTPIYSPPNRFYADNSSLGVGTSSAPSVFTSSTAMYCLGKAEATNAIISAGA